MNRSILDVLDKVSELEGQNIDEEMEDLAVHAHNIRNNFFDSSKRLVDIIPDVLLKSEPLLDPEVDPRNHTLLAQAEGKGSSPAKEEKADKPTEKKK